MWTCRWRTQCRQSRRHSFGCISTAEHLDELLAIPWIRMSSMSFLSWMNLSSNSPQPRLTALKIDHIISYWMETSKRSTHQRQSQSTMRLENAFCWIFVENCSNAFSLFKRLIEIVSRVEYLISFRFDECQKNVDRFDCVKLVCWFISVTAMEL